MTQPDRIQLLQGTLDLLVLRTLVFGPLHGHGIMTAIRQMSEDVLLIDNGSLYPSLQRLELKGLIAAQWEISERNRRARVYRLTAAGRKALRTEISRWGDFVRAVGLVLDPAPAKE